MQSPQRIASPASGALASLESVPTSAASSGASVASSAGSAVSPVPASASLPGQAPLRTALALRAPASASAVPRVQPLRQSSGSQSEDVDAERRRPPLRTLSASEDDGVRTSDSGASSSHLVASHKGRLEALAANASTPNLPEGLLTKRPLLAAAVAGAGPSRSSPALPTRALPDSTDALDRTISASSSRSNLASQSGTSMYRQQAAQASASNRASVERGARPSEDGSGDTSASPQSTMARGSNLARAKSVSSVSSVNSTSSMEAVPFRAAPLGQTRPGFGGYGRNAARQQYTQQSYPSRHAQSSSADGAAQLQSNSQTSQETQEYLDTLDGSASSNLTPSKQRMLPKGPSDEWLYRNAPGMGSANRRHAHTVSAAAPRPQLRNVFDIDNSDNDSMRDVAAGDATPRSTLVNIRSKIAKRAGKLGLKPLTSVSTSSAVAAPLSSPPPQSGLSVQTNDLQIAQLRTSPGIVVGAEDGDNDAVRADAQSYYNRGMPPLAPSSSSGSASIAAAILGRSTSPFEVDGSARRTSSVTNAPLIVPKHPPGPPGSAPPPSPGLTGMALYQFAGPLGGQVSASPQVDGSPSRGSPAGFYGQQPILSAERRPGSIANHAGASPSGSSTSKAVFGPVSPPLQPATPPLTPAQRVQLDARAGVARLPDVPSGASPGPNPAAGQAGEASDVVQRPLSTSILPSRVTKPTPQRFSSPAGAWNRNAASADSSLPKRPSILRGLSRESLSSKRSSLAVQARGTNDSPQREASPRMRVTELARDSSHDRQEEATVSADADATVTAKEKQIAEPVARLDTPGHQGHQDGGEGVPDINEETTPSNLPSLAVSSSESLTPAAEVPLPNAADKTADGGLSNALQSTHLTLPTDPLAHRSASSAKSEETAQPGRSNSEQDQSSTPAPSPHGFAPTPRSESVPPQLRKDAIRASSKGARTAKDFYFGDLLGEGSYSTVIEAWDLAPLRASGQLDEARGRYGGRTDALAAFAGKTSSRNGRGRPRELDQTKSYAIKVLDKMHILKEKKQKYVGVEKDALSIMSRHPGVITLYWTFQDQDSLYFVLELAPKGELLTYIKKLGSFDETCARFYAAQLLETIDAMHKAGVIHRDVKPENVLLDKDMRIRVADFGSAKISEAARRKLGGSPRPPTIELDEQDGEAKKGHKRPSSFVGTAEYVSPELLTDKQVSEASDVWAFGCVLFQMLVGRPPFKGPSEYQTFQKIMSRDVSFPHGLSEPARDLLEQILKLEADQRPSCDQVRAHPFFEGFDWSETWVIDAPQLSAGLFKRPQEVSRQESSAGSDERHSDVIGADTDGDGDFDADDGRSMQSSLDDRSSAGAGMRRGFGMTKFAPTPRAKADGDQSSVSEHDNRPAMRQRGFSTGASTGDRMIQGTNTSPRRGSSGLLSRVTAGLTGQSHADGSHSSIQLGPGSSSAAQAATQMPRPRRLRDNSYQQAPVTQQTELGGAALSWAALLLPQESLLYACPVVHKASGALLRSANKKRQLLLTDFPRLLCVKETNDQLKVKSEIILAAPEGGMMESASSNGGAIYRPASLLDSSESEAGHPGTGRDAAMTRQMSANSALRSTINEDANHDSSKPSLFQGGSRRGSSTARVRPTISSSSLGPKIAQSIQNGLSGVNNAGASTSSGGSSQTAPNLMKNVELKSGRTFVVYTAARTYVYEDPGGDASHWVKSISTAARRYGVVTASSVASGAAA